MTKNSNDMFCQMGDILSIDGTEMADVSGRNKQGNRLYMITAVTAFRSPWINFDKK